MTDLTWIRAAPEDAPGPGPWIEIAFGPGDNVHLRETSDPDNIVTTTRTKWEAFTKGVRAGEFDHFADPDGSIGPSTSGQACIS
ncbi:DUF397 domain-containing protein [Streptomyces brevispora]|uniref:DUF397 domain-containing protein n=2 Tax=Streptomyces brevispora TaxID=887462 RepID=UPI002E2F69F3|nr:DUF397 domain-containing protein [Streptomyces brevispora]